MLFEKYTCQRITLSGVREGYRKNDFHVIFSIWSFYFAKTPLIMITAASMPPIAFVSRQD